MNMQSNLRRILQAIFIAGLSIFTLPTKRRSADHGHEGQENQHKHALKNQSKRKKEKNHEHKESQRTTKKRAYETILMCRPNRILLV